MADVFGDDSLFSEFDRDRDTENIFIQYDRDATGAENRSRIIFAGAESDSGESDMEDAVQNEKETTPPAVEASGASQEVEEQEKEGNEMKEESNEGSEQSNTPQSTTYQENFEKNKLRQFARIIDSTRSVADELSPAVQIVFQNNRFAKKYRSRIEQYIMSLAQHADQKDFSKPATDLSTKGTTVATCVDINDKLPAEKRNARMWQAHGIIGCAQFHNGFMVDTRGWPHDEDDPKELDPNELPKYFQLFEEVFPPEDSDEKSMKPPPRQKDGCFNCGGNHRLNECSTPKDQNRIRAKRREKQESMAAKSSNPGRYHEDPELDPKKAKFNAGSISDGLRKAMGLKENQLPSYIYRMRMYGYPPGWLLEANRKAASLAMYDKDGRETNIGGESLEDGEYGEQATTDLFDVNKIIEYPGFTVPVPQGFVDECESKGLPPLQQHQLKRTLMEQQACRDAAKKRQLEEEETTSNKKMKVDHTEKTKNEDEKNGAQTSPPAEAKKGGMERSKDASPTMDTLQAEYAKIIDQLDTDGGDTAAAKGNGAPDSSDANAETKAANPSESDAGNKTPPPAVQSPAPSSSELLREKNFSFSSSASIGKDFGTPILVREKSFKALPDAGKFSQGVEEHIPFENLPDSVGTFERMKNLFSLLRNKMRKTKK